MDPLSLVANLIAVAGAASKVAEGFERILTLRNAPQDVLQFVNEISDFRTIIALVKETLEQLGATERNDSPNNYSGHLSETLQRATKTLSELNNIIQTKIVLNDSSSITQPAKVSRSQWMRRYKHIKGLVENMQKARLDLSASLTVLQASEIPKTRATIDGIILHNESLSTSFQHFESQTMSQLADIQPQIRLVRSTLQNIMTLIPNGLKTEEIGRNSFPYYEIRTSVYGPRTCTGLCMCRCHQKLTVKSPSWMQNIIGQLFVSYYGTPILSNRACNEKRCHKDQTRLFGLTYFFPAWFLHRILFLRDRWTPTHGHVLSIRTPRVIGGYTSPVFLCARFGNLSGLRSLFTKGLASPFDTDKWVHQSALHTATKFGQYHICEFLLSQGADPESLDYNLISPIDVVWEHMLGFPDDAEFQELKRIFGRFLDVDEMLQKRKFTTLHKIVLKFSSIPIQEQLRLSTTDIDARCANGMTALEMAIRRKDTDTMKILLESGANFRMANTYGLTPFHIATMYSVQCLRILLAVAYGTRTNEIPEEIPFSNAPASSIPTMIQTPLNANSGIKELLEQRACTVLTPLAMACGAWDRTGETVRLLLDHSADLNNRYKSMAHVSTPLTMAIQHNNHAALSIILSRYPDVNLKNEDGQGVLHVLAGCGDKRTFDILLSSGIIRVAGIHDKDINGRTALDIFDTIRHSYVTEDAERSWCREALLSLINWRDNNPFPNDILSDGQDSTISSTDSEGDVFYDLEEPLK